MLFRTARCTANLIYDDEAKIAKVFMQNVDENLNFSRKSLLLLSIQEANCICKLYERYDIVIIY